MGIDANTVPFYIRDLSSHRFWYQRRVLELALYKFGGIRVQASRAFSCKHLQSLPNCFLAFCRAGWKYQGV
jgi:hypothetical protein